MDCGCCELSGGQTVAACVGFVFLIVLTAVLLGVSVKTLDTNELGLDLDTFSMEINDKLYEGGTFFLGLAHVFIEYPRTQQTIRFASPTSATTGTTQSTVTSPGANGPAIPCRSSDGLPVYVSYAVNYRLRQTFADISHLYLSYGTSDEVDQLYQRIANNIVRSVASRYEALRFVPDRDIIRVDMRTALNTELSREGALVDDFLLLDVGIPASVNEVRVRQESARQEATRAENDRRVAQINADARVSVARQEASLIVTQASTTAQQATLANAAAISALVARYTAERQSYQRLRESLNMTTAELLNFIWLDAQSEASSQRTTRQLINLPPASQTHF